MRWERRQAGSPAGHPGWGARPACNERAARTVLSEPPALAGGPDFPVFSRAKRVESTRRSAHNQVARGNRGPHRGSLDGVVAPLDHTSRKHLRRPSMGRRSSGHNLIPQLSFQTSGRIGGFSCSAARCAEGLSPSGKDSLKPGAAPQTRAQPK